jgi:thiamine biosynthesis lipoprotein
MGRRVRGRLAVTLLGASLVVSPVASRAPALGAKVQDAKAQDGRRTAAVPKLFSLSHPAMGTTYTLFLYAGDQAGASREAERAFAIVDDVEALLSNYQPQSELSRINHEAYAAPVTTDPETFRFLEQSLDWSARSDGAFDITAGALMKAWGFFRSSGHVPDDAQLAKVRGETGWRKVQLDAGGRTVRFSAPGIELDPGGIGKGFAVERVVEALRADGVRAAMLSAGSSTIYALGAPPGKAGWRVDVPDPLHKGRVLSSVVLRDTSLSTASCAEKHFMLAGHLYCHIMDPRMLRPVEGRLQATVITPSATDGDALSNVMFVEDAAARQRTMKRLGLDSRALVVSGTPEGATERCTLYRWHAPLACSGGGRMRGCSGIRGAPAAHEDEGQSHVSEARRGAPRLFALGRAGGSDGREAQRMGHPRSRDPP